MIDKLGPYRIQKMIGRGGMGTVYAGIHESDGTTAAIKVLSIVLADDRNFRERFITEIETLKKLNHPNIVRLFGDGEQDGHLFYVMELVEGQSLQSQLQAGHVFQWREVNQIGIAICRALRHAHDRGVIHRDLKPANLLRHRNGDIKLTDFGIAKLFGSSGLTADGSVVGTADYMSPEQAEGRPVSNRTDLYSLGSVMYTLLARRPPFSASSVAQVVHKLRYEEPPAVRRYAPKVPFELDQVIGELLQKDPADRISNALVLTKRLLEIDANAEEGDAAEPADTSEPGHVTKVSPTAIDAGPQQSGQGGFSWNEATIVTSGSQSGGVTDEHVSSESEASRDTVADCEPRNRFTSVDEVRATPATSVEFHRSSGLPAVILGLALLLLLGATAWLVWPESADRLHAQIVQIEAREGVAAAKKSIDRFLIDFPKDPRAASVRKLQLDVECQWLQSRLALRDLKSGGSQLADYEQQLLVAMRSMKLDPPKATALLEDLLVRFGESPEPDPGLQQCLRAARHLLDRPG